MKKLMLTAALLFVSHYASATTLDVYRMDLYNPNGSLYLNDIGIVTTTPLDSATVTGAFHSGIDVGGSPWSADVVWASETSGPKQWKVGGVGIFGAPIAEATYNFNLAPGQVAFGLFADWAGNYNIPLLSVFDDSDHDGIWVAVDTDVNGVPGTAMLTVPVPGFTPAYSAVAVPAPGSMLLIGSGLVGLLGLGNGLRRKK